jgi:hypothetical protein
LSSLEGPEGILDIIPMYCRKKQAACPQRCRLSQRPRRIRASTHTGEVSYGTHALFVMTNSKTASCISALYEYAGAMASAGFRQMQGNELQEYGSTSTIQAPTEMPNHYISETSITEDS